MSINNKNANDIKASHEEVALLLPWYLNGTLEPKEHREVESHLAVCSECRLEMEGLKMIQSAIVESNETISVPALELDSVMDRIEAYEANYEAKRKPSLGISWWRKIQELIPSISLPSLSPVPVAAAALIIIQFAVIAGLVGKFYFEKPSIFKVLSGPEEAIQSSGSRILVAFQEGASEKEIRETLLQIGGKIVDGPKAQGLYVVEISMAPKSEKSLDKVLEELRAKTGVIKLAEPAY